MERVLHRFGHEHCNLVVVPSNPNSTTKIVLCNDNTMDSVVTWPYRECIGWLQFEAIGTRFDIRYIVSNAAKFSSRPNAFHVSVLKRILWYIWDILEMRIIYKRGKLVAYTNLQVTPTSIMQQISTIVTYVWIFYSCWIEDQWRGRVESRPTL